MFGLIRLAFSLLVIAIVVWFATTVQLGSRTLWGHLRAIGGTHEAHELAQGTRDEAKKVAERLLGGPDMATHPHTGRPLEEVSDDDRAALDKLVQPKAKKPR